ncbi:MAG: hypothetical protein NXH78_13100 [Hyphomonadaceae bacterium]|nr:hypothetical protein [Hyphomonadaceae bacterium]
MFVDNFTGIYYLMFLPVAIWAAVLAWKWIKAPELGEQVYDSNVEKGLLNSNVPRDEFVKSFARAERPRLGVYQCGIALLALVLLPALIAGFYGFTHDANVWGEDNVQVTIRQQNLGNILGDFLTIIIIMAINAALLAAATFFYYRNRPPSLRSEIRRLEEQYK